MLSSSLRRAARYGAVVLAAVGLSVAAPAAGDAVQPSGQPSGTVTTTVVRDGVWLRWTFHVSAARQDTAMASFVGLGQLSAWQGDDRSNRVSPPPGVDHGWLPLPRVPAGDSWVTVEGLATSSDLADVSLAIGPGGQDGVGFASASPDLICDLHADPAAAFVVAASPDGAGRVVCGTPGDDAIDDSAGSSDDLVVGDAGDDHVVGFPCGGVVMAGPGDDEVDDTCPGTAATTIVDGGTGRDHLEVVGARLVEGGPGADTLVVRRPDVVRGGAGDDTIVDRDGRYDEDAPPLLFHHEVWGDRGDDTITVVSPGATVHGGDGGDAVSVRWLAWAYGDGGDDLLVAGAGGQVLAGGRGDDTLRGGIGQDLLHGDQGDDRLEGGNQADLLWGDDGADVLVGGEGVDVLDGGPGRDVLHP